MLERGDLISDSWFLPFKAEEIDTTQKQRDSRAGEFSFRRCLWELELNKSMGGGGDGTGRDGTRFLSSLLLFQLSPEPHKPPSSLFLIQFILRGSKIYPSSGVCVCIHVRVCECTSMGIPIYMAQAGPTLVEAGGLVSITFHLHHTF